jgi:hypothetical protein
VAAGRRNLASCRADGMFEANHLPQKAFLDGRKAQTMSLFYFDFRQGDTVSQDTQGSEFATTEEAYLETHQAAREMWSTLLQERRDPRRCAFEVRDSERQLLFLFPFEEVMEYCKDPCRTSAFHENFTRAESLATRAQQAQEAFKQEISSLRASLKESRELLRRRA